jgi:hypothetical protein
MIEIITGKTWAVSVARTSGGDPVPFVSGDTIRAQLRETPAGAVLAEITAAITSESGGTYTMGLTDEETALLPVPRQFGAVRFLWLDTDIIRGADILPMIVNEKIAVIAGVTKEVSDA